MSCLRTFFPLLSLTLFLTLANAAAATASALPCRGLSEAARPPCWGNGDDFWHQACILYLLHLALLKPRLHTVVAKRDRDDNGGRREGTQKCCHSAGDFHQWVKNCILPVRSPRPSVEAGDAAVAGDTRRRMSLATNFCT